MTKSGRKPCKFLPNFNGFHYKTWDGSRNPALFLNRTPGYPVIKPEELALISTQRLTARVQSLRAGM